MRSIEDTAFIWGGFDFDNIGPVLLEVRPFPNSIAGSRRRMVFSVEGETMEVKCLVFMGSSFRRRASVARRN